MAFFPVLVAILLVSAASPAQVAPHPEEAEEADAAEEAAGYRYAEQDLVEARLEEILSRPEFARLRQEPSDEAAGDDELPEWLDRLSDWLSSLLGDSGERDAGGLSFGAPWMGPLLAAMAAVILLAALVFLAKAALASAREKRLDEEEGAKPLFGPGSPPGELAPSDYLERAQELAARGEHKGAIRELLLAAMSALERAGRIRFRKGLTNRDYLRAAPGASRSSLSTIVYNFEHVYFGRREATAASYEECLRELRKSFSMEPT